MRFYCAKICDSVIRLFFLAIKRRFQMECKHPYEGPNCDICAFGYFGYPFCQRKFLQHTYTNHAISLDL